MAVLAMLWLWCAPALAGTIEVGFSTGLDVWVVQPDVTPGAVLAPRVALWPGDVSRMGIELEPAITLGPGLLRVQPRLKVIADVGGSARSRWWVPVQLGADVAVRGGDVDAITMGVGIANVTRVAGILGLRTELLGMVHGPAASGSTDGSVSLTFGFTTGFRRSQDADRDQVPDRDDACPEEPEDPDDWRDDDGCPERDDDLDGVRDELDACDHDPEDVDGVEDEDGCPE